MAGIKKIVCAIEVAAFAALSLPAFASLPPSADKPASPKLFRVVIDPGHGGNDLGTTYRTGKKLVAEKDLTLALSLEVARVLRTLGFSTALTRDGDDEVPLPARTALANKLKADVFLSIHMNSLPKKNAAGVEGIETYILNHATDAPSKRLASLENSVLGAEPAAPASEGGNDVALILKDLRLDASLPESKRLACMIQSSLVETPLQSAKPEVISPRRKNRGVKQALFYVLLGADMPSVLVEAGFLNSAQDRNLAASPNGQHSIAVAIAKAIERFRKIKDSPAASMILSRCKVH
jgi:N-acetylmuramoyl-L-alanine amidase